MPRFARATLAPRTYLDLLKETAKVGRPTFRDSEVLWQHVRCLASGECVSVDGTHLGHNQPDDHGNRYWSGQGFSCDMRSGRAINRQKQILLTLSVTRVNFRATSFFVLTLILMYILIHARKLMSITLPFNIHGCAAST